MDEFDSVEIGSSSDNECNRCGMDTGENKCCRDEVKVLKLHTSHVASHDIELQHSLAVTVVNVADYILNPFKNYKPSKWKMAHSPPSSSGQDIQIENCVFRI